jgi:allantoin racemase
VKTKRIKMILPVPLPAAALAKFAAQIPTTLRRPDVLIDFAGCRAGATTMDSAYESTLADAFVLDAGANAEAAGYDAVCSFSMSDSGLAALRSRLSIPVIGAGQAALLLAAQMGHRFSVITMWEPWRRHVLENAAKYGLAAHLASVRHIDVRPNTQELLAGKEHVVFGALADAANAAITRDGADVIVLGSTTMYQAHAHLAAALPCPVVSPGLAAYKTCETLLDLGLSHSKLAYPSPEVICDGVFHSVGRTFN